jgi:hypothetical protein
MNSKNRLLLYIGSTLFISIGGYHIFLPYIWGWEDFSKEMPDMIEWALYAVNFLMSSLMMLLGIFTLIIIRRGKGEEGNLILLLCGFFWILNFAYQIVNPTPIPDELYLMKMGFLIPPVIGACCYFIPYFMSGKPILPF